jgi:hypothetical protein
MRAPAPPRAGRVPAGTSRAPIPTNGGFTFAEHPELEAPDARIIWRADFDPGALHALSVPIDPGHPDAIHAAALAPWLTVVSDTAGEHAVLSDGWRHIRIDIEGESLVEGRPVMLRYVLHGVASAEPKILPLRRLLDLCRHRRFSVSLYPPDRRIDRWILALRVHDAMMAGASQSDIARVLFDDNPGLAAAARRSDSLRSRVRRLAGEARRLAAGGYRALMTGRR